MLPVITLSAIDRGASVPIAAFIAGLLGIASVLTNIPAGILTTRVGERIALVLAAAISAVAIVLCIVPAGLWAFGLGVLPLAIASGAGSGAQRAIGTGVLGGMLAGTALGLFFIPLFFVVVQRVFNRKLRHG